MLNLVDRLRKERDLAPAEFRKLLECADAEVCGYLHSQAREVALNIFGNRIFIRGLIEMTNVCRNDCLYCGIRKSNSSVRRYTLSTEEILTCCKTGYSLGFRTFVLQGGEWDSSRDAWIEELVRTIRTEYPDVAITLSLGEKSREAYERFFRAGANRYLLRHETADPEHYSKLHPSEMSLASRMECLGWLKEIGYQTGAGMMVGSPYQTSDNLVEDIQFIRNFKPEMIGAGPFLPQKDTPFGSFPPGSAEMTAKLYSIFRLMLPDALIPSTTAMTTVQPDGREKGILAGANVVMPNLSPAGRRKDYSLYDGKKISDAEAAEGLAELEKRLSSIGYDISFEIGNFRESNN